MDYITHTKYISLKSNAKEKFLLILKLKKKYHILSYINVFCFLFYLFQSVCYIYRFLTLLVGTLTLLVGS